MMRKKWYQLQKCVTVLVILNTLFFFPANETKRSKEKKRKERDPSQTQSRRRHTREKSITDQSLSQLSASHTQTGNGHASAATVATRDPSL